MKIRLLKRSRSIFHHTDRLLRTFEALWSTYNTPTIITWIGPWRNVILCGNTSSLRAEPHFHILDLRDAEGLTCMNLNFSIRCMMMGRMTDRKGGKKESREEEDHLRNAV